MAKNHKGSNKGPKKSSLFAHVDKEVRAMFAVRTCTIGNMQGKKWPEKSYTVDQAAKGKPEPKPQPQAQAKHYQERKRLGQ